MEPSISDLETEFLDLFQQYNLAVQKFSTRLRHAQAVAISAGDANKVRQLKFLLALTNKEFKDSGNRWGGYQRLVREPKARARRNTRTV